MQNTTTFWNNDIKYTLHSHLFLKSQLKQGGYEGAAVLISLNKNKPFAVIVQVGDCKNTSQCMTVLVRVQWDIRRQGLKLQRTMVVAERIQNISSVWIHDQLENLDGEGVYFSSTSTTAVVSLSKALNL